MKITKLTITNFRSIIDLELPFPNYYTAICGTNDAGKTTVLRAIRAILQVHQFPFGQMPEVSSKDDWPKWVNTATKDRTIRMEVSFEIFHDSDAGLHRFIVDYLSLADIEAQIALTVLSRYGDSGGNSVTVTVNGAAQDVLKSQEVLKKLQSSDIALFHNSTEILPWMFFGRQGNLLSNISDSDNERMHKATEKLNVEVRRVTKQHQKDLEELLGRLQQRYKVSVSTPNFDITQMPISINLGDDNANVPLEQWGSGTQNRTRILMALFKAKRVSQTDTSAATITPLIIIEEPESFPGPRFSTGWVILRRARFPQYGANQ